MIKAKVGLTWRFNWVHEPGIQRIVSIYGEFCKVQNLKGNAIWGREGGPLVRIQSIENCLNHDRDYKVITHYSTRLGKILYK